MNNTGYLQTSFVAREGLADDYECRRPQICVRNSACCMVIKELEDGVPDERHVRHHEGLVNALVRSTSMQVHGLLTLKYPSSAA